MIEQGKAKRLVDEYMLSIEETKDRDHDVTQQEFGDQVESFPCVSQSDINGQILGFGNWLMKQIIELRETLFWADMEAQDFSLTDCYTSNDILNACKAVVANCVLCVDGVVGRDVKIPGSELGTPCEICSTPRKVLAKYDKKIK